jgi:hypothetical protein
VKHSADRAARRTIASSPRRHARPAKGLALTAAAGLVCTALVLDGSPAAFAGSGTTGLVPVSVASAAVSAGDIALPFSLASVTQVRAARQSAEAAAVSQIKRTAPRAAPVVKRVTKSKTPPYRFGTKKFNLWYAQSYMLFRYHWNFPQFACLAKMWGRESAWNQYAWNHASDARGIPQAQPGEKMAKFGRDWRTNPTVQIRWGLAYIRSTYGTPCQAWSFWQGHQWY